MSDYKTLLKGIVYGTAVGDALGVPYEFKFRETMQKAPCIAMVGYGTHMQPAGTWSDDTSLMLCLVDGLHFKSHTMDIKRIVYNMLSWFDNGEFSAYYEVFDYGGATAFAMANIRRGVPFFECGGVDEYSNGNGSLMRIAPMSLYTYKEQDIKLRYNVVRNISSITHRHDVSVLGCFILTELMRLMIKDILRGNIDSKENYVLRTIKQLKDNAIYHDAYFRIFRGDILSIKTDETIKSSGYVVHTLEASLYSFLTTTNFKDCVLRAVNLGDDTDTTAAVAGAIAGLYYGFKDIPIEWLKIIANRQLIDRVIGCSVI